MAGLLASGRLVTPDGGWRCGQDPTGDPPRDAAGARIQRRGTVRRSGPDYRSGCGADDGDSRVGSVGPARTVDNGHTDEVHRGPSHADSARQLRAPARLGRRPRECAVESLPEADIARHKPGADFRAGRGEVAGPSNCSPTEDAWPGPISASPRTTRPRWPRSAVDCPLLKRTSTPADAQPGDIVLLPDGRPGTYLGDNRALLPAANGQSSHGRTDRFNPRAARYPTASHSGRVDAITRRSIAFLDAPGSI